METSDERCFGASRQETANSRVPHPLPHSPLHPWTRLSSPRQDLQRCLSGVPLLLRTIPITHHYLSDATTLTFEPLPREHIPSSPNWTTPHSLGKRAVKPPPSPLPSPYLLSADDEPDSQCACLIRSIRETLASAVDPHMGTRQWGLIMDSKGHLTGFSDLPTSIASLPYLPSGICHAVAFWGTYTPPTSLTNMATHIVFIQLRGSHQLVAHRAHDIQCYPVSTVGDAMELPRALFTRASLTFQTGTKRSFAVLISILYPGSVGRALKRLAPGTLPKRVLQSIHLIRRRHLNYTWSSDTSSLSLQAAPTDSSSVIKFFTLNVQHTFTNKLAPLRNFIEFHEFLELLYLHEIGTTSATFRFHPLYEPFFSVWRPQVLGSRNPHSQSGQFFLC